VYFLQKVPHNLKVCGSHPRNAAFSFMFNSNAFLSNRSSHMPFTTRTTFMVLPVSKQQTYAWRVCMCSMDCSSSVSFDGTTQESFTASELLTFGVSTKAQRYSYFQHIALFVLYLKT
jgi:hypothetical protein